MDDTYAVLFDMDGVLVDSEYAMRATAMESLERFGIHPQHEDFRDFVGMGEDRFIGGVAAKYGLKYETEMKDYAYQLFVERAKDLVQVFSGARQLLDGLKQQGFRIAVASAADLVKVKSNLSCIGIAADYLDALVTGSEVERKKPYPDIYLRASEKVGMPPARCIVVEDAVSGIQAANAAGSAAIGVTTFFDLETLQKAGAAYVAGDLSEVHRFILEWRDKSLHEKG